MITYRVWNYIWSCKNSRAMLLSKCSMLSVDQCATTKILSWLYTNVELCFLSLLDCWLNWVEVSVEFLGQLLWEITVLSVCFVEKELECCQRQPTYKKYSQRYEIQAVDSGSNDFRFFFFWEILVHRNCTNVIRLFLNICSEHWMPVVCQVSQNPIITCRHSRPFLFSVEFVISQSKFVKFTSAIWS